MSRVSNPYIQPRAGNSKILVEERSLQEKESKRAMAIARSAYAILFLFPYLLLLLLRRLPQVSATASSSPLRFHHFSLFGYFFFPCFLSLTVFLFSSFFCCILSCITYLLLNSIRFLSPFSEFSSCSWHLYIYVCIVKVN